MNIIIFQENIIKLNFKSLIIKFYKLNMTINKKNYEKSINTFMI